MPITREFSKLPIKAEGNTTIPRTGKAAVTFLNSAARADATSAETTSGGSASGTWHTVKLRVEDGKVSMWIKLRGEADSAYQWVVQDFELLDYSGGYISLMTNANAAFDNLTIIGLDPQAAAVRTPSDQVSAVFQEQLRHRRDRS